MKKSALAIIMTLSVTAFSEEITVYGPKSMDWIGKKYAPIFKEKTGNDIKYVSVDSINTKLALEKKNPKADIVVGITELTGEVAKQEGFIRKYTPENISRIKNEKNIFDKEGYVTPIDFGLLAVNYNIDSVKEVPRSLTDLSKMQKSLIVEDPRSTTGSEVLLWSIALYGEGNWKKFWTEIKPAIYTVTPGWSEAFAKFTAGEAPMMMGYATSNIFFYQENEKAKYNSFIPSEGGYMYMEGAALVNKKEIKVAAKEFMDELLNDEFQELIATANYMYPVTEVELPKEFSYVPKADKVVTLNPEQIKKLSENIEKYKEELVELLRNY